MKKVFLKRNGESAIGRIVVAVVIALVLVWGAWTLSAPIRGKADAFRQTESGDYRIENYEMFKDKCNAIVAQDNKIIIAKQQYNMEVSGPVNTFREQQLAQNYQALMNVRLDQITEYNSDASKSETRAKFLDSGLPKYINPTAKIGSVSCPSE